MKSLKNWLIFKLVGNQPVIMNIDVYLSKKTYKLDRPILVKNVNLL